LIFYFVVCSKTSATLHYLLYEVCVNTDVQNKLYEEIKSVIKSNESVTEEHLEKLKYLKYVVKESMRLHSVAPTNSRIVTKDIKIENYIIPKGVIFNLKFFNLLLSNCSIFIFVKTQVFFR